MPITIFNLAFCSPCAVKKDRKWGIIDKNGKEIVPFIYEVMFFFDNKLCGVRKDYREYGYIDIDGKVVIPFIYDNVGSYWEGGFNKVMKYGFINKKGVSPYPPPKF